MPKQDPKTNYFICDFCGKQHKILPLAISCFESHNVKFVPMTNDMLNRLLQFIYTKDSSLLSDDVGQKIISTIRQYLKVKSLGDM